jgi:hypothetical protein
MINCILYTSKNKNKNLNDISRALKNIWVCGEQAYGVPGVEFWQT